MIRTIFLLLLFPFVSYSQGLEGGFIDNNKNNLISRITINQDKPADDLPVSDIIAYEKSIITFSGGMLYGYDTEQEKSIPLLAVNVASVEFIQLEGSNLYMNLYDETGNFKAALQYDLSVSDPSAGIIQEFSFELVEVLTYNDFRFIVVKINEGLKLGYSTKLGEKIIVYDNVFLNKNYKLKIDSKGVLFAILRNVAKPTEKGMAIISAEQPAAIEILALVDDTSFAFVNGHAFFSSEKQLLKAGSDTGYKIAAIEGGFDKGYILGTNFFSLSTNVFGMYYTDGNGTKNIRIVDTKGVSDTEAYTYSNLFEKEEYLVFAKTIVSILQADENHIAITNNSGSSYQTLVVDNKGNILNTIPTNNINIITSYPAVEAKVFSGKYLSIHFQQISGDKVNSSLCYFNLVDPSFFAFDQIPTYTSGGYEFTPELAVSRNISYIVYGDDNNGFELNTLSTKVQNGYQIAEEVTNDEFTKTILAELGVSEVSEKFSTYPENLISINNTLFYMAHLASGDFNGYSYLYKVNTLPTNIGLSSNTVSESINSITTVANAVVADVDDDNFSFSLVSGTGGEDNGLFSITGTGLLRTIGGFNYEEDSTLNIKIRISDPHGAVFQKAFVLNVTNANDAPTGISLTSDKIGENATIGTKVADISTVDEDVNDSFTYTLVDDAGGAFAINEGELLTNQEYDQLIQNEYTIKVRSTDSQSAFIEQDFVIGITESNTVPNDILLSDLTVDENGLADQVVGELSTEDADAEDTDFTYELVEGTGSDDNANFVIDNAVSPPVLKSNSIFDFETIAALKVRIRTTDPKGANFVKQFQITVNDVNDAPDEVLLTADSIAENAVINSIIGTFSTVDVDANDTFTYALVTGSGDTDNSAFSIDAATGELKQAVDGFDFESKNTYSIRVSSTDSGGESVASELSIKILDINEAPSSLTLSANSVNEEDPNAIVGTIKVVDPDQGDTYVISLLDSLDNSYFELAAGGLLGLSNSLNFEDANLPNPLSVVIQVTDNGGEIIINAFSISVIDVDDPLDSISVVGNPIFSGEITTDDILGVINIFDDELLNVSDYDRSLYITNKFDATGNDLTDDTKFNIIYNSSVGTFGQYQIKAIQAINYDENIDNIYDFTVSVTNGGATAEKLVIFEVKNPSENIRPTMLNISDTIINENTSESRLIGTLTTDDPNANDTFGFSLDSGFGDNSLFEILGNELLVKASTVLNFSEKNSYEVRITATETNTVEAFSVAKDFNIAVEEYIDNEAPIIDISAQPSELLSDGTSVKLTLAINDWELSKVEFQKTSLLASSFNAPEEIIYDPMASSIDITVSEADFDAFGMKLKIIATDESGNQSTTANFYVYRRLLANNIYSELPSEHIGKGRLTADYKMFSIPYEIEGLSVKDFLERQLAVQLGSETFQVFQYDPTTANYINGVSLNNFEHGRSYWFTTLVDTPEINFGAGQLYPYKAEFGEDSVFVFKLKQGWNQIGNPYPVPLDWAALIAGSNIGQLQVYDKGSYETSSVLPVHGGAFVLVQEDTDLAAVIKGNSVQRVEEKLPFDWKLDITVSQNGLKNDGSIGMHEQAKLTLDPFDIANPPHFSKYVEIDFNKSDRFYANYKQDIVNSQAFHIWVFNVNSHKAESPLELSWVNEGILPNQLFLIELETLNKVDMANFNQYSAINGGKAGFKLVYSRDGASFNLGDLLVGQPIPNPTNKGTSLSLNLPVSNETYQVTAEIVDLNGRSVKFISRNSTLSDGYHTLTWDGNNSFGDPVSSGIYLYRITINGAQSGIYTGRILKQH